MRLLTPVCFTGLSVVAVVSVVLAGAEGRFTGSARPVDRDDDADLLQQARNVFKHLPKDMATAEFPVAPARVRLGRMLFFDPRISADGTGSCVRCHQPALYGADGLPGSLGLHDKQLPRNAPTVFNAGLYTSEHWDGRFANVEAQAKRALLGTGFGVTNDPADLYKFKVAGLRNVAMTSPYFHDGTVDALPKAVRIMAKVQLDTDLADAEIDQIVTFLGSLTGSLPEGFERAPVLPPGGFGQPSSDSSRSQNR
jgi:cytochrome c peroxidase